MLARLATMQDSDIDYSDVPPSPPGATATWAPIKSKTMSDKQPQSPPLPSKLSKQAFEQWLRDEIVSAYQQLKTDPAWDMRSTTYARLSRSVARNLSDTAHRVAAFAS